MRSVFIALACFFLAFPAVHLLEGAAEAGEEPCLSYAVMLEPNSGPMPSAVTPPRFLEPPRFLCNAETKMEAYPDGLIVCRCF